MLNQNQKLEVVTSRQLPTSSPEFINLRKSINATNMLNNYNMNGNRKSHIKCLINSNDKQKTIYFSGQKAATLINLKEVRNIGLTTIEAIDLGLLRISSYIHLLRHEDNINITTIFEGKKRTARYVLIDNIEILETPNSQKNRRFSHV